MGPSRAVLAAILTAACVSGPSPQVQSSPAVSVLRVLGDGWSGSAVPIRCEREGSRYLVAALTAGHVLGDRLWVQLFESPDYQFASNILPVDQQIPHEYLDIAVLLFESPTPVPVCSPVYRAPVPGEMVTASGFALGATLSIAPGNVGGSAWYWDFPEWEGAYHCSAFWRGGCSGGAVLDSDGRLLGIIVGGWNQSEHIGIFLPVVLVEGWI